MACLHLLQYHIFTFFIHKYCKVLCKGKSNFSCFHNQYRGQVRWAERVGVSDVWPRTVSLSVVMAWDGCRHNMALSQREEGTVDYSPSRDSTGRRVSAPARDRQNSTCHVKLLRCSHLMSRTGSNKKNTRSERDKLRNLEFGLWFMDFGLLLWTVDDLGLPIRPLTITKTFLC